MKNAYPSLLLTAAVGATLLLVPPARANQHVESYVATHGSDSNPGTDTKPFRTLEQARDAIRSQRKPGVRFTVWICGGVHYRRQPFELATQDSGTEESPTAYRSFGAPQARLSGGQEIPRDWFQPVTDPVILARLDDDTRDAVLQADLKTRGIHDYGPPGLGGGAELFCNDRPLQLARWPNEGWALARRAAEGATTRFTFTYPGDKPNPWHTLDQISLHGYWRYDYQDQRLQVQAINVEKQEMTLAAPVGDGTGGDRRFCAVNVLEEIDCPGEWYLDRTAGTLYLLPPADFTDGRVVLSILDQPLVVMRNVSHVTWHGLIFEASRGTAVVIEGGTHGRLAGCTIRNIGGVGVALHGGTENTVVGCDVHHVGAGGIVMSGGDRATLVPAGLAAVNNHIHHFARHGGSYQPAVRMAGVGNRMAHNLIHDAPHTAVLYQGNDHVIEFNEIHDVVLTTSDAGVLYSGYDWTFRGNVVRYNFFHHIPHLAGGYTRVVYMDDAYCATKTFGNVFYKTHESVWIGGGRDNEVENNIFVECDHPISLDNRGLRWTFLNPDGDIKDTGMYKKLTAFPYDKPPWSTRYPKLARILRESPRAPLGNTAKRNVSYRSGWRDPEKWCRATQKSHIDKPYMEVTDNFVTDEDPGFVDTSRMNFGLKDDSIVYRKIAGFERIPFEKIGLYQDELRATWPVVQDTCR